jgi:hypothetical protein
MWYLVVLPILFFAYVLSILSPYFVLSNSLRQAATDTLILKSLALLPDIEQVNQIISEQASELSLARSEMQLSSHAISLQWNHRLLPLGSLAPEFGLLEAGGARGVVQHVPLIIVLDELPLDITALDCSSILSHARRSAAFSLIEYYKSLSLNAPNFLLIGPDRLEDYRLFSKRFGATAEPLSPVDLDPVCLQAGKEFAERYSSETKEAVGISRNYASLISSWLYDNQAKLPANFKLLLVSANSTESITNEQILSAAEKLNTWAVSSGRRLQIIWVLTDSGKSNEYLDSLVSIYQASNAQISFKVLVLTEPATIAVKLPYLVAASSRSYKISR